MGALDVPLAGIRYGWPRSYRTTSQTYDGAPRNITCKYCLCDGFHWKQLDTGWRLHNADGSIHTCRAFSQFLAEKYGAPPLKPKRKRPHHTDHRALHCIEAVRSVKEQGFTRPDIEEALDALEDE